MKHGCKMNANLMHDWKMDYLQKPNLLDFFSQFLFYFCPFVFKYQTFLDHNMTTQKWGLSFLKEAQNMLKFWKERGETCFLTPTASWGFLGCTPGACGGTWLDGINTASVAFLVGSLFNIPLARSYMIFCTWALYDAHLSFLRWYFGLWGHPAMTMWSIDVWSPKPWIKYFSWCSLCRWDIEPAAWTGMEDGGVHLVLFQLCCYCPSKPAPFSYIHI